MPRYIQATATVQAKIVIRVKSTWGEGCTIEQAFKQAKDDALVVINKVNEVNMGTAEIRNVMLAEVVVREIEK